MRGRRVQTRTNGDFFHEYVFTRVAPGYRHHDRNVDRQTMHMVRVRLGLQGLIGNIFGGDLKSTVKVRRITDIWSVEPQIYK